MASGGLQRRSGRQLESKAVLRRANVISSLEFLECLLCHSFGGFTAVSV